MNRFKNSFFMKKIVRPYKNILFSAVFIALILVVFQMAVSNTTQKIDDSAYDSQLNAVRKAMVQCYALEGFYPPTLDYLVENYGVIVDSKKFTVNYVAEGQNILPDVIVIKNIIVPEE